MTQKLRRKITLKMIAKSVVIKKWSIKFNKSRITLSSAGKIKLKLKRRSNLPKMDRMTTHMTLRRLSMRFVKTWRSAWDTVEFKSWLNLLNRRDK